MFDFEKLEVYQQVRGVNKEVLAYLFGKTDIDKYLVDELKRASLNAQIHLAEGVARMTDSEKKQYFVMARSSVFEAVTVLQTLTDLGMIDAMNAQAFYYKYESVSKMLLGLYRSKE